MVLEIKWIDDKKYCAKFKNTELEINEFSENWNITGINKFLIELASDLPDKDEIELKIDEEKRNNDKVYNHIVDLFCCFVQEYNNNLKGNYE